MQTRKFFQSPERLTLRGRLLIAYLVLVVALLALIPSWWRSLSWGSVRIFDSGGWSMHPMSKDGRCTLCLKMVDVRYR